MRSPSIVRRLVIVTVSAGLITGVAGVLVVQAIERRAVLVEAQERNLVNAERTANLLDSRLEALGSQLALIATRPAIGSFDAAAGDHLAAALRVSDPLERLVLYDLDGVAVAAAATSSLLRTDEIGPLPTSNDDVLSARIVTDADRSYVSITVPVNDPPGNIVGWLVGHAPVALLTAGVTVPMSGPGAFAAVVSDDGSILAHREFDRVVAGERHALIGQFADEGNLRYDRDGEQMLASSAALQVLPGWVVVEQPAREALLPLQSTTSGLTGVLLAVIVAIVIVVIVAGRRLLRPLGPLADAVERVGSGERRVRVSTEGSGEVGVVTTGFNRMAESLEEREDELRRAEAATRRSEERLRLMVEGVEDYAIVLLDVDGSVRTWNTGARRLVGLAPQEALGRALSDVFDPDDPPPDPLAEMADSRRAEVEGWCRRADGGRFWAAITATRLEDDDGAHYGYAVILHDLTARRATREAIATALRREQEAASELRRANDLKDEFLSIAAHEIRTPLSVILGASRLLGREGAELPDDDVARVRAMIETHADDMRSIVDRLLDFTRLQAGKVHLEPEPIDLPVELDDHLRALHRHLADHDIALRVEVGRAVLDRAALRHIVTNLVSNAAKFSPPGTTISIHAELAGTDLVLSIADQGVGVAPADQELIFELFRHARREVITARGTGVGLAIVKRYVDLLGGHITVDSSPDRGATFTVRLPCPDRDGLPEHAPAPTPASLADEPDRRG